MILQGSASGAVSPAANKNPSSILDPLHFRNAVLFAVVIAVFLQLVIFFSVDNLIASALLLCGAFVGLRYAVRRELLHQYPISTLSIIGYTAYHFVIPPIGKLLDFQSILVNLDHTILVWAYGLMGLLALVAAHYAYRRFSPYWVLRWSLANGLFRPLHFFEMPDNVQFWIMGAIGIGAALVRVRLSGSSALSTAMGILEPLIYTPYFTAFPNLIDPRYRPKGRSIHLDLILYSVVLLGVSAMVNSRGFALLGFASLAVVYGYRILTGTVPGPKLTLKAFIVLLACLWLATGPMVNLAASMLVARRLRGTISPAQLAQVTWSAYRSNTAVKIYQQSTDRALLLGHYNESYYNNILLNRLANVRFTDLSLDAAHGVMALGDASYFRRIQTEKVIAIIPTPLIKAFHLGIDKKQVNSGSSEDFLRQLATGSSPGSFLTGSYLVILRMTFGMMWPIFLALIASAIFTLFDASSDIGRRRASDGSNEVFECVTFNPIIAGTLFSYVFYFSGTGPQDLAGFLAMLTRGWIETVTFYAAAFVISKWVSSWMFGWVRWKGDASQRVV